MTYKSILFFWVLFICYNLHANESEETNFIESRLSSIIHRELKLDPQIQLDVIIDNPNIRRKILHYKDFISDIHIVKLSKQYGTFIAEAKLDLENIPVININGKFASFLEVPTVNRVVRSGEAITGDMLEQIRIKSNLLKKDVVVDRNYLQGKHARTAITMHKPILKTQVENPPVIFKDDIVTLLFHKEKLELKTVAIALEKGGVGDKIKVKNEKSGIIIYGRIQNKNIVVVSE